jgi:deoxyadenosine/deoxycytidine kinase
MAKQIDELQQLDREIRRLQQKARSLEQQIDDRLDYFQDNYRSLAIKSFLPAFLARTGLTGTVIELFLDNQKIRDSLNQILGKLFDKISDGIEFLTDTFGKKKNEVV